MKNTVIGIFLFPAVLVGAPTPDLLTIYRDLHSHPELSFEEKETARKMAIYLKEAGYEVTEGVGGYGVVGVLRNGPGKTVLVRADLDALPIEEQTGLDYASRTKGVMHACGHDVHLTNLVSVARALVSEKKNWQGNVLLIAQPAEEKGEGAKAMLRDGLLKRFPKPDFAIAFHVSPNLATNKVAYLPGPAMATADSVDIVIKGRGGHGAMPQDTVDPVPIASHFVLDLQNLTSREKNPNEVSVISVGSFHCGTKHNVISDECKLQLTVRTFNEKERQRLFSGIRRKAKAAAVSAGAPDPQVDFSSDSTPALTNSPELVHRLIPVLKKALGEENVVLGEKATVSEDFARYGLAGVPIAMFRLGSITPKRLDVLEKSGVVPSLHSSRYFPDVEETIATGTRAFVAAVKELVK